MIRHVYQGRILLAHGFHTGDGRRLDVTDQPLARDADGRLELSGSSLAGVLRADSLRLARAMGNGPACSGRPRCGCVTCGLFGPRAESSRDTESDPLRSSKLYVRGGPAIEAPRTRIRDRVGIDRKTHTAADRRKYDVEVAEAVTFPFELRCDDPDVDEREHLEVVLRRLATGWLFLGGKSASGLGRAELTELEHTTLDLADRQTLIGHLLGDGATAGGQPIDLLGRADWLDTWRAISGAPAQGAGDGDQGENSEWAQIRLGLRLELPYGLLVNDPTEAMMGGFDHAFLRYDDGRPVLAGSALRGVLRSRAEQILRTLAGPDAACDLNTQGEACHQRLEETSGKPRKKRSFEEERAEHCLACRVFGSGRLASAFRLTDFVPEVAGSVDTELGRVHEMVAIDRVTGGAADGAKFDAQVSAPVVLHGELSVELGRDRLGAWEVGLLLLGLRDLLLGDLPFGFGTAKGLNEYRATITSAHRFWIRPPALLAAKDRAEEDGPGMVSWISDPGAAMDRPSALVQLGDPRLAQGLRACVEALHEQIALSGPWQKSDSTSDHQPRATP